MRGAVVVCLGRFGPRAWGDGGLPGSRVAEPAGPEAVVACFGRLSSWSCWATVPAVMSAC